MHDIKALEDTWKKYHKKRFRPYYIALVFLFIAIAIAYYFLNMKQNYLHPLTNKMVRNEKPVAVNKKSSTYNLLLNGPIISLQQPQEKRVEESKPVVGNTSSQETDVPVLPMVDNIPVIDDSKDIKREISKHQSQSKVNKNNSIRSHKKVHLNIIKSSNANAYKEVERRFNQFQDADDSLFLARIYYKNAKYEKAAQWALKTNKVNADIEESWIIFAKSKVKMGKVKDAIRILKSYIRQSNSQEAKQLLLKIQK